MRQIMFVLSGTVVKYMLNSKQITTISDFLAATLNSNKKRRSARNLIKFINLFAQDINIKMKSRMNTDSLQMMD